MTKKNIIHTDEEYIAQGFFPEEVALIREHDVIFNKIVDGEATEEEIERMYGLIRVLGI